MDQQPEELDWQTLANRGPVDNAFVRLIDVELVRTEPLGDLEQMFGEFDPEADPEQAMQDFLESMEEMNPLEMVEMVVAPIKVIPKGAEKDGIREAIVIPRIETWISEAERQLEETGTLSGYVSTYQGDEFLRAIVTYAGGEELLDELGLDETVYTIEPMAEALDRAEAGSSFWFCGIGMALGLVLCGSGGPTLGTCVFFSGPAILSLLGYPMRYGRGERTTRIVYLLIGAGLVCYAYQLMIVQGQFGQIGGQPLLHSSGFVALFFGVAAALAVPTQIVWRKVEASLDAAPSQQQEVNMSVADACSLRPLDTVETVYHDRDLVPAGFADSSELKQWSETMTTIGFNPPEDLAWQCGEEMSATAIQVGCQHMVVSDSEMVDGRCQSQMVSVLHDGMVVITLSPNVTSGADRRVGSNGVYQVCEVDDAETMLAQHLKQTISIAEKRDTSVVNFDSNELNDVCHLARRVLADIQYQYGESTIEVDAANYGRFRYPMQSIPQAMTV
jgi:hypothetical protein